MTLTTKDGVKLSATYFPSTEPGKNTVPVVILHDAKESRQAYADLARKLSQGDKGGESFAVLTIDLRGHGESVKQTTGGRDRELTAAKLRSADYAAMVTQDMAAVRKFLVTENDNGKLNLNRMSIVGIGLGAAVGMNYTALDWSIENLPTVKQSKDVRTLVLISPRWKQNGLSVQKAVRQEGLRKDVAVLMMYGAKDRRVNADAQRIHKQLARDREKHDPISKKLPFLMKAGADSELQGAKLLKQAGDKGTSLIARYLKTYSVDPEFDWVKRRKFD